MTKTILYATALVFSVLSALGCAIDNVHTETYALIGVTYAVLYAGTKEKM